MSGEMYTEGCNQNADVLYEGSSNHDDSNDVKETDELLQNQTVNICAHLNGTHTNNGVKTGKLDKDTDEAATNMNEIKTHTCDAVDIDEKPLVPDGGWGWFIVLGCLIRGMMIGGIGRSHGIFYIKFRERFHGSSTSTALITSLTGFVRLTGGPFVSILTNRFSCRSLTAFGAVLLCAGLILSAFTPNQGFLYFSYGVVCGVGRAFSLTPAPILLGYYFKKRRSLAFGLSSAGFTIGGFAISPLVEVLFQTYGFQGAFIILAGLVTHLFITAALFRSIELQRNLMAGKRKNTDQKVDNDAVLTSMENIETGDNINSTISIDRAAKDKRDVTHKLHNVKVENGKPEQTERTKSGCCLIRCVCYDRNSRSADQVSKKKKWISFSILKDVRFVCYMLATVCFTLPTTILFLPSLAKSKGVSEIKAAYLLSIMAGIDTVVRVISGFVLDIKIFRNIRPEIFCAVSFCQSFVEVLYPFMTSFREFMAVAVLNGTLTGVKAAQGAVILLDILGVDKFASSLGITMAAQGAAVFLEPFISGQIKDHYDTYDGAFYFSAAALFAGAAIMTTGQLLKYRTDRNTRKKEKETLEIKQS